MKKIITKYPKEIGIILLSLIIVIISLFTIGFLRGFIIVLIIDGLYFGKDIINFFKNRKKKNTKYNVKNSNKNTKSNLKKYKNGKNNKNNKSYKGTKSTINSAKGNKLLLEKNQKNKSKNNKFEIQNKKKNKHILKKVLIGLVIAFFVFFLIGIIAVIFFCYYIVDNAPDFNPNALYRLEPTIIYDMNGNEIDKLGAEKRINIEYEEIPEVLINAIIATEDSKFFQHNGVDIKRFIAASFQQLRGVDAGGASTITMQLSKKNYTNDEASGIEGIIRKFTDVYVSVFKIEPSYTKEEILTFYVNSNFLGGGYGVEQTALTYFGKSAKDLNIAEAAMIAGLFQAPGKYNPYTNPEATEKRRKMVLKYMLRHGYITKEEYDIASQMTVDKIIKQGGNENPEKVTEYQSFVDQVVKEVKDKTKKDPYQVSMKIYTTMDPEKQKYVTDIMNGTTYEWENELVKAGVAVIDVNTGAVVALGGGRNINTRNGLNYASQIKRQIGSTAKPLYDYGPAIEYLNWSTYAIVSDEPISYSDGTEINNWDGGYQGFETMRRALTYSRNIPALKAFKANDKANILKFVTSLGLSPEIEGGTLHEAHAIGGYTGENAMTMAAAYAAFANGGYYSSPYTFTKIEYSDGTTYDNIQPRNKVMSEQTAYMVTSMLIDTAQYALGWWANINNQQYGAKTGTTNFDRKQLEEKGLLWSGAVNDLWTVGFNTRYAIGVWYGYDEFDGIHYNLLSSGQHERLFQAVGRGIFNSNEVFTQPEGVIPVTLEYGCPTACLPSAYTPDSFKTVELFIQGTEPSTVSDRFDKLESISNLKATASGNTVTLTWSGVKTPRALDANALTEYYRPAFQTGALGGYVGIILQANQGMFGTLGYNVYSQDASGNLSLLGFTTNTTYTIKNQGGDKTYVVKTTYSNFPSNMSDGKSVSISLAKFETPKEKFIKQVYSGCLGREATQTEITSMSSYNSASTIALNVCDDQSAISKYSTADTAIPTWYKGILGRTSTSTELTTIKEIFTNKSRQDALKNVINSADFKSYCSNNDLVYTDV